jgi:predicted anti-sigma-YlaC factor YlaD
MKCHSVQKKFSACQDKELKPQEQEEISRHLLSCQFCREQYAEFERVWKTLGELEEIRPDPWFYGQVLGKIKEPRKHGLLPGFQWVFWILRAPAIASVILVVGLLAGSYLGSILARCDFFPFQNISNSEGLFTSLKVFDPAPPGTLAEGYLRMVSYKESESK